MFYDLKKAKFNFIEYLKVNRSLIKDELKLHVAPKELGALIFFLNNDEDNSLFKLAICFIWINLFCIDKEYLFYQMYQDLLVFMPGKIGIGNKRLHYFIRMMVFSLIKSVKNNKKNQNDLMFKSLDGLKK